MEKEKRYRRYSLPVKLLILLVLIVSTIAAGVTGSRLIIGANYGMTFRELMNPVPYEESRQAGVYLTIEGTTMQQNMAEGYVQSIDPGYGNREAWLIRGAEETNALFYAKNLTTGVVYTNVEDWGSMKLERVYEDFGNYMDADLAQCLYVSDPAGTVESSGLQELRGMSAGAVAYINDNLKDQVWSTLYELSGEGCEEFQLLVGLNTTYPLRTSQAYVCHQLYQSYAEGFLGEFPYLFFAALGVMILMLILIARQAGHNSRNREIHLKRIDRSPIEIWIAADIILIVIGAVLAAGGLNNLYWQDYWNNGYTIGLDNMMLVSAPLLTGGLLILVLTAAKMINLYGRRIKAGTLGGSMIRALGKRLGIWFGTLYRTRSENGKLILRYVGIALVNLILFLLVFVAFGGYYPGLGLFFLLILVLVNVYLLYRLVQDERGKDAIMAALREISQGNLEYQIDADEMSYQNREMAEEVNRMRDGLKRAVETQLKSERLKTDLIANVSHDIKTPLTSIINYVDILNREHFEDERIAGYVDILVRKSARLKQLTDDLIEASKISSGNITLNMQDMNLKQLIKQTNGEFEEKFAARHLQLVCTLPEEELMIRADGRRMYRVLDNLYNNAAKYAMPYSRVYVDGENRDGKVIFSIKNMSENPLNVSAEELMERFVRGDASRTTEGSGLGLEIARNLTVMQKGTFRLYLDGDLFKVVIVFGEPEEPEHTEREAEQANDKAQTGGKKQEKKSGKGFRKPHLRIRFRKPVTVERDTDPVSEDDNGELLR